MGDYVESGDIIIDLINDAAILWNAERHLNIAWLNLDANDFKDLAGKIESIRKDVEELRLSFEQRIKDEKERK